MTASSLLIRHASILLPDGTLSLGDVLTHERTIQQVAPEIPADTLPPTPERLT